MNYSYSYCSYTGAGLGHFGYINPRVVIKNEGTVPIESFNIHFAKPRYCFPFYECWNDYHEATVLNIDSLNILPGDTTSVDISNIYYTIGGLLMIERYL